MGKAKEIRVEPISSQDAKRIVCALHYSGRVDTRSQVHFGVFYRGRCGGAIQYGPPIDKRKALMRFPGCPWNGLLELARLALADWMPRCTASRALAWTIRYLGREMELHWIQSYADATQSGDGAIYRALGFDLAQIKKNDRLFRMPDGKVQHAAIFDPSAWGSKTEREYGKRGSEASGAFLKRVGAEPLEGWQILYIRRMNTEARTTLPVLDYEQARAVRMYRGERLAGVDSDTPAVQAGEGGASPTARLHSPAIESA